MSDDDLIQGGDEALLLELREAIAAKLAEPSPPVVYTILLAAKMRAIADRLQRALLDPARTLDEPLQADLAALRTMADIVEQSPLGYTRPGIGRE